MAILCILYFSGGSRFAWEERSMAKIFLIWGSDTWMEGRWQTCNTLGVWLLKESRDLLCLHPHSWEVSSWRRNPRTQIKIPSWSQALYFSPSLFLSTLSLPLSPWARIRARAGQGRPARPRPGGRRTARRPAKRRLGGGGRLGRPEVGIRRRWVGFSLFFLNFTFWWSPKFGSMDWMEVFFLEIIHAISFEISLLFKVGIGKNLILIYIELIPLYKIDG